MCAGDGLLAVGAPAPALAALVALALACEGGFLVGLAIPGTAIALGAGSAGVLSLPLALAATVPGVVCGAVVGFARGRSAGPRSLPLPRTVRTGARLDHPVTAMLLGPWLSCGRVVVPRVAGARGVAPARFLLVHGVSVAVWATAVTSVGALAGAALRHHVATASAVAAGLALAAGVVVLAVRAVGGRGENAPPRW